MRTSTFLLFVGLSAAVASAQVGIADDPKRRAQTLLNSLREVKSEHFLDASFGVYAERRRVGQVEVSVGGTSSYDVLLKSELSIGATRTSSSESLELAPNFALRRKTKRETVSGGEGQGGEEDRTVSEGEWLFRKTIGGTERVARLESTALQHDEFPSLLLLVRAIDPYLRATYRLESVGWDAAEGALQVQPLVLRVEPKAEFTHRGKAQRGGKVHVSRGGVAVLVFYLTKAAVLEVEFLGTPLRLVHGTPKQVARDLPSPASKDAYRTPQRTVAAFLKAAVGDDPDALDAVCDWEAMLENGVEKEPTLADVSAEEYAESIRELYVAMFREEGVSEVEVRFMAMTLLQKIDGDTARVWIPGVEEFAYELERRAGRWWIVGFGEQ